MDKDIEERKRSSEKAFRKGKRLFFLSVMLLPAVYAIFRYVWVNGYSILIAFTDSGDPAFDKLSLTHFKMYFAQLSGENSVMFRMLMNTFKCFGIGLLKLFLSYAIAYFLYKKVFLSKAFRFIFFLPSIIAPAIAVSIFKDLIGTDGWLHVVTGWKDSYPSFLVGDRLLPTILLYDLFLSGFGTNFLIIMGAMNRIPQELLEAAQIDGCKPWREFWQIITPLVWETFSTLLVLQLTGIFTSSGPILYFTGGGKEPYTLSFWIFDQVRGNQYNYPAAVGLFYSVIAIPIVFGVRWIINRVNPEVTY